MPPGEENPGAVPRPLRPHPRDPLTQETCIHVVAAVIRREGRFLLCQRPARKRHGGLWEFPGGKLEPGESAEAAAHRELREELGVAVRSVGPQLFAAGDGAAPFLIAFHPVAIEGEPQCLEHAAIRWVGPEDLAPLDLAPSDRQFIRFLGLQPPQARP